MSRGRHNWRRMVQKQLHQRFVRLSPMLTRRGTKLTLTHVGSAGIIERSCVDGQKTYHSDLEKAMRAYIHQHRSEFLEEGQDVDSQSSAETASLEDEGREGADGGTTTASTTLSEAADGKGGVASVLRAFVDSARELFGGLSPTSAGLAFVVLVLVLSNLWTLASRPTTSSRSPLGHPSRPGSDRTPDQVAVAVRDVLRDYFADAAGHSGGARTGDWARKEVEAKVEVDPRREAEEIAAVLDDLEARILRLRGALTKQE
jgi:hypothetical protein